MELQQAFDPKRLAVSVLPHSIVHSLDVYRSICSKVLAKVPCTCVVASRSLLGLTVNVFCLFWSRVCFAYVYLGVSSGVEPSAHLLLESLGGCSLVRS